VGGGLIGFNNKNLVGAPVSKKSTETFRQKRRMFSDSWGQRISELGGAGSGYKTLILSLTTVSTSVGDP
jgi:hypothetical protein